VFHSNVYRRICVGWTKELRVFCVLPLDRKTDDQIQVKGHKHENSKVVKITTLRDRILIDTAPMHVHNPKKMKRKDGGVVSEPETMEYKFVFKNRRLDNFDSLPYGFD